MDNGPPTVPTNVQITGATPNSLTVSFSPATDDVGITGYVILVRPVGGTFSQAGTTNGTSFTITGLAPGSQYEVAVVARDAAGNTAQSAIATGSTTGRAGGTGHGGGGIPYVTVSTGGGIVRVIDPTTNITYRTWNPFGPGYQGVVNVAQGDVNGDGFDDILCAANDTLKGRIRVYDGLLAVTLPMEIDFNNVTANPNILVYGKALDVFEPGMVGKLNTYDFGVTVASADVNGDGFDDIIAGTAPGAGPGRVVVWSGADISTQIGSEFRPYGDGYLGGVQVAAGDLDADGIAEVVTGTTMNKGRVKAFSLTSAGPGFSQILGPVAPFADNPFGIRIAVLDTNGDGRSEIAVGALSTSGSVNVVVLRSDGVAVAEFGEAQPSNNATGFALGGFDGDRDGNDDVMVGILQPPGGIKQVILLAGGSGRQVGDFDVFAGLIGGVSVAGI